MNRIKHIISLHGFNVEKGKIPLTLLGDLSKQLIRLSERTLLSYVEGSSNLKRGLQPEWLRKSLDFQLSGISEGSTVIEIEAPYLSDTLGNIQLPIYSDINPEQVKENSALGFSIYAYEQALNENDESYLLDKDLLKEILCFRHFVDSEGSELTLSTPELNKSVSINRMTLEKIILIEERTPESMKTKISGKLDVLRHTKSQLEIITGTGRMHATLSPDLKIEEIIGFFGQKITAFGSVRFLPSRQVKSFEIESLHLAESSDKFFEKIPEVLFEKIDVQRLISEQSYQGINLHKIIGKWPGDESIEELLLQLKK